MAEDYGHYATELILKRAEVDVTRVYRQATEEVQKKLDDYLRKFQVKDQVKLQQLAAGEITQQRYNEWRIGQIMMGKRWEEMRDTLATDLQNANNIARSIVNGHMPDIYAINHNYATFQVEKESLLDTSYTLYDRDTVERIIRDQPDLLPSLDTSKSMSKAVKEGKVKAWERGQIQSVTMQSILQGESIPQMSRRIAQTVGERNRKNAIRYARTSVTGAQNAGRVDAYKRAEGMGIELEQEWLATLDGRTRHEHRQLDGQRVMVGDTFKIDGEEIRFPGDPTAAGYLIWNCRCTLVPAVKGVDQSDALRNSKLGNMTYDEWKAEHEKHEVEIPDLQGQIGRAKTVGEVNDIMNGQDWFRSYEKTISDGRPYYDHDQMKWVYPSHKETIQTMADLTGVDLESAKSIASSYQRVYDRYPQLKGKLDPPDAQPVGMGSNTYAWCYIRNHGKVQVNPSNKFYGKWSNVVKGYESDVLSGWHPAGTTAESIVIHELGHAVDGLLAREGIIGGYTKSGEFRVASSSLKQTIMNRAAKIDPDIASDLQFDRMFKDNSAVSSHVSRYAATNSKEWFAECFAEYLTSANPRTVSRLFGEELERLLGKVK